MKTLAFMAEQLCHQQTHSHWKKVHSVGLWIKLFCRFYRRLSSGKRNMDSGVLAKD
jgi:hypothetical protein